MNLTAIQNWLDDYRGVAFELIRIYLGIGLLVRGVLFLADSSLYVDLVEPATNTWLTSPALVYFIASIHLVGGALLIAGLFTRLAALVQTPILVGAVFVVHLQGGLMTASQSLEFSTLVLFLLLLVFLYGPGQWAADSYLGDRLGAYHRIDSELDKRIVPDRNLVFGLIRAYVGIGLFVRGMLFISNSASFLELIGDSPSAWLTSVVLSHFITLAHLFGGALMAIGLLTRLAALVQIPVLVGAVFVVHLQGGLMTASQSFEFSALVLFLLLLVFLYGSGRWSADYYLEQQLEEREAAEAEARTAPTRPRAAAQTAASDPSEPFVSVAPQPRHETLTCPRTGDTCDILSAERPRHHNEVTAHPQYSLGAMFYFLVGITGPPKEIHFTCERCELVVEKSRTKEDLNRYRYRR